MHNELCRFDQLPNSSNKTAACKGKNTTSGIILGFRVQDVALRQRTNSMGLRSIECRRVDYENKIPNIKHQITNKSQNPIFNDRNNCHYHIALICKPTYVKAIRR
jgi:hypothetical protein